MTRTDIPLAPGPPVRTAVVMCVASKAPVIHFYNSAVMISMNLALTNHDTNLVPIDNIKPAVLGFDRSRLQVRKV